MRAALAAPQFRARFTLRARRVAMIAPVTRTCVILSPHLDDAVLSCWHLLEEPDHVSVINIFAGIPSDSTTGWWDATSGGEHSSAVVRTRIAEDREALSLTGTRALHLDFLDDQYRRVPQAITPIIAALRAKLPPGCVVLAPAALAVRATTTGEEPHPDHVTVRAAALALQAEGHQVQLYADLPHASEKGWPSWVDPHARMVNPSPRTGDPDEPRTEIDALWERGLRSGGLDPNQLAPEVRCLDADALARKVRAVRCYRSQIDALEQYFGKIDDPGLLGYEVVWRLPATAAPSAPAAARNRSASASSPTDRAI